MIIVKHPKYYRVDSFYTIKSAEEYILYDTETDTIKKIKGSSLMARLRREEAKGQYSICNVVKGDRHYGFKDIEYNVKPKHSIAYNPTNGEVSANFTPPFTLLGTPIVNNNSSLTINDWVLDFLYKEELVFDGEITIIRGIKGNLTVKLYTETMFLGFMLDDINIESDVLYCTFKVCYMDTEGIYANKQRSSDYPLIINLKTGQSKFENVSLVLKSSADYISDILINNTVAYDCKFKSTSRLTNYYECPVYYEGRLYNSAEAAYQSAKTTDAALRDKFIGLSADDAKKLGRKIQNSDKLRPDWFDIQYKVMQAVVRDKFSRNEDCYNELISTAGYNLIEDTTGWHDKIWGKCYCERCHGLGRNWLGHILTKLRKEYIGE